MTTLTVEDTTAAAADAASGSPGTPEDEAAKIWQELEQAEAAGAVAADPPPVEEEEKEAPDVKGPPPEGADASGASGSSDATVEPSKGEDKPDIWAGLTDEQKAALDADRAELKRLRDLDASNRGRQRVLSKQLDELRRQTAERPAPKAEDVEREKEERAELEKTFPEVAGPVLARLDALQAEVEALRSGHQAIVEDRFTEATGSELELLLQSHPDGIEIAKSKEFGEWVQNEAPDYVRAIVERNATAIVDAEGASLVLSRYKQAHDTQPPAGIGNGGDPAQPSAASATTAQDRTRARQLASAASPRSRGPSTASIGVPEEGDPVEIWKAWDRFDAAQEAAARR